jgi:hypothetical protein
MMLNYEAISKIEGQVEGLLKRIQKAYLDVDPKVDLEKLKIESKDLGSGMYIFLQQLILLHLFPSSSGTTLSTQETSSSLT